MPDVWSNLKYIMLVILPVYAYCRAHLNLVRGSESGIYSHKVRMYVRGGSRSGMSRGMSLHATGRA